MKKKDERRSLYRIEISGSMVFYKKNKGYKIFNRYSNISQLKNITKSGACLEIKNGIKKGERFKLLLVIPGEKKFEIMGRVRWKLSKENEFSSIGIQFEPFGKGKNLNPVSSLKKLREISNQYSH